MLGVVIVRNQYDVEMNNVKFMLYILNLIVYIYSVEMKCFFDIYWGRFEVMNS